MSSTTRSVGRGALDLLDERSEQLVPGDAARARSFGDPDDAVGSDVELAAQGRGVCRVGRRARDQHDGEMIRAASELEHDA